MKLLQILSEDGHFFLMEAKLSLCHLPESFDEYDGALDATEHMDTVLRYRHPTMDGSHGNYGCLLVNPQVSSPGAATRNNRVSVEERDPNDEAVTALSASSDHSLIFLCSSLATTPHQLGFHRLRASDLRNVPTISEPEEVIDMRGRIVGIALDRTGRYLHVNVRKWPEGAVSAADVCPPIAEDIEMKVLDLTERRFLDVTYKGHKGFTNSLGAFIIYLDTSDSLVASGGEDRAAHIWDRRLGCGLARNTHEDVVNCVAFSPRDPEMMVSVGDDNKVKIWISRRRRRELCHASHSEL